LAATNQVVSAALVAERGADDEEGATTEPQANKLESSLARSGANKSKLVQANEPEQQIL
jgi:hypothetical protein